MFTNDATVNMVSTADKVFMGWFPWTRFARTESLCPQQQPLMELMMREEDWLADCSCHSRTARSLPRICSICHRSRPRCRHCWHVYQRLAHSIFSISRVWRLLSSPRDAADTSVSLSGVRRDICHCHIPAPSFTITLGTDAKWTQQPDHRFLLPIFHVLDLIRRANRWLTCQKMVSIVLPRKPSLVSEDRSLGPRMVMNSLKSTWPSPGTRLDAS